MLIALRVHMEKPKMITLRGILIPSGWNETGDVVAVAVATYDEEKYLVSDSAMVSNLLSLLRKRVVVNGIVNQIDTDRIIDIKDIRIDRYKTRGKRKKDLS